MPRPMMPLAAAFVSCALAACASQGPGRLIAKTSPAQPLDAAADNRAVLEQLTPGLVMTIEIDGSAVTLLDSQVALVPKLPARRPEGELITVTGFSAGEQVSHTQVPDQRLNAAEGGGLVVLERRTVAVALPLERRVDEVAVQLPGQDAPAARLDVRRVFEELCAQQPRSELCKPTAER